MFGNKPILSKEQEQRVLEAIREAERNTSGEIRIHIEKHCKTEAYQRAVEVFEKLGMTQTEQRNGVLIYIALSDHLFSVIGDQGINEKVAQHFWEDEIELMRSYFKKGEMAEGLVRGILAVGEQLKQYFPYGKNDVNELKDDISYGKDV